MRLMRQAWWRSATDLIGHGEVIHVCLIRGSSRRDSSAENPHPHSPRLVTQGPRGRRVGPGGPGTPHVTRPHRLRLVIEVALIVPRRAAQTTGEFGDRERSGLVDVARQRYCPPCSRTRSCAGRCRPAAMPVEVLRIARFARCRPRRGSFPWRVPLRGGRDELVRASPFSECLELAVARPSAPTVLSAQGGTGH
jgi:hypothetical protein